LLDSPPRPPPNTHTHTHTNTYETKVPIHIKRTWIQINWFQHNKCHCTPFSKNLNLNGNKKEFSIFKIPTIAHNFNLAHWQQLTSFLKLQNNSPIFPFFYSLKKRPLNDILIIHNTNYKYDHGYHLAPIKQMFFQSLILIFSLAMDPLKKHLDLREMWKIFKVH